MAITATGVSGMKMLSIDKALSTDSLMSLNYSIQDSESSVTASSTSFGFAVRLPSFASGSAQPDEGLACAARTFGQALRADLTISSIVVVGHADRRELLPAVRRQYASNLGLAQQRGAWVGHELVTTGITPSKILVTVAGPEFTVSGMTVEAMARDRAVTSFVYGTGARHSWTAMIREGNEWTRCDRTP